MICAHYAALGLILGILGCLPQRAQAVANCLTSVSVQALPFEVTEHHDRGVRELSWMNQSSGHPLTRNGHGLGSTRTHFTVNARISHDHQGCTLLQVEVGYSGIDVYVARELADSACAFAHVREHEWQHVALNRRWLTVVPAFIQTRLARQWPAWVTLRGSEQLKHVLETSLSELKQVQTQHDAFDSPWEYHRNSTACGGRLHAMDVAGQL